MELGAAWRAFATTLPDDLGGLADRLDSMQPVMSDERTFEVTVYNTMLQNEVNKLRTQIESFMRERLSHPVLTMKIVLDDSHHAEHYLTRGELLIAMRKENPALEKLEEVFQLTQV